MKNIIYITTDDPKTVIKYKDKIKKLCITKSNVVYDGFEDKDGCFNKISHLVLPYLSTNKRGGFDQGKIKDVYKVTIDDSRESTIEKI